MFHIIGALLLIGLILYVFFHTAFYFYLGIIALFIIVFVICTSYGVNKIDRNSGETKADSSNTQLNYGVYWEQYNILMDEAKKCADIVNNTLSPDAFFSNFHALIFHAFKGLISLEESKHINFNYSPSKNLAEIKENKDVLVNNFVDRYCDDLLTKINSLDILQQKLHALNSAERELSRWYRFDDNAPKQEKLSLDYTYAQNKFDKLRELITEQTTPKNNDIVPAVQQITDLSQLDWYIMISFNKSTSANFEKALYYAKLSNKYEETEYEGQKIYQATFSKAPQDFINFIELYNIIGTWKSTKAIINGIAVNKKIVSGIKRCYGDKCLTGRSKFCYGASGLTNNPFGCHRLQVSRYNNPWWSFNTRIGNTIYIDKEKIKQRIDEYSTTYKLCPCFNYDIIMSRLDSLPNTLTSSEFADINLYGDDRILPEIQSI